MCKAKAKDGGSGGSSAPEAGQFEDYDGFACTATIGMMEAFIGDSGEKPQHVDIWLGDSGTSHHIKSSPTGMINVTKCPPGTTIRQVQGIVGVEEWGTVLLQVDGQDGKRVIKLEQTLIVPGISVNLFSMHRVLSIGYLLVYGEVADKCILKKKTTDGAMMQIATMSMKKGRATLDCKLFSGHRRSSGPALQIDTFREELNMQLLHRQLGHSEIDTMQKLLNGKLVRGIDSIKVDNLQACDFCELGKLSQAH